MNSFFLPCTQAITGTYHYSSKVLFSHPFSPWETSLWQKGFEICWGYCYEIRQSHRQNHLSLMLHIKQDFRANITDFRDTQLVYKSTGTIVSVSKLC